MKSSFRKGSAALALVLALVVLVVLLTGRRPDAAAPVELVVGAHYYPWYGEERWAGQAATDTPVLGRYSSGNRAVANQHIRWAREADLDFFMISCLGPDGREAQNFREAMLPELDAAEFRFALHYETPIALGLRPENPIDLAAKLPDGAVVGDRLAEHFDYLAENYLTHPRYLRHDGRAVVMVYLVRNMVNAGPYLKAVRSRLAGRGVGLYLIADVMYWEKPGELDWSFLAEHFDAVTAYNMYHRPDFLPRVETQYRGTDTAARARGLRMIPHVLPGYDDTRLRGADRPTYDRRGGEFYRAYWKLASEFVGPDQPFLMVTTFNEWHEGTELEPSVEYGDLYLRLTRELVGGLRSR